MVDNENSTVEKKNMNFTRAIMLLCVIEASELEMLFKL